MSDAATIRTAFDRNAEAVRLRPGAGKSTETTSVRMESGTACVIEDGEHRLTADTGEAFGGGGSGPSTNGLGRAALGACIALGASVWAAKLDVPIDDLEVDVITDFDARGFLDVADIAPGWQDVRYEVRITSPAPREEVERILEKAHECSPIRDCFNRALDVGKEWTIVSTAS